MTNHKEKLVSLQKELSDRIAKIDQDLHSRKTSTKFSEQVTEHQNDDVLFNLKEEAQFELNQIEQALIKVENERYGVCEKCHTPINEKRLEALPFAATCATCIK